jgi:hypothetical protein
LAVLLVGRLDRVPGRIHGFVSVAAEDAVLAVQGHAGPGPVEVRPELAGLLVV